MPELTTIALFIPTFFLVSITPGMCMLLALSLGMSIGLRRTLPMMLGELCGVALVAMAAAFGVAAILLTHPMLFTGLKLIGGAYLIYLGINSWRSSGGLVQTEAVTDVSAKSLAMRGFLTAIANPKGWAFMVALLPPFLNQSQPLLPQMLGLLAVIMVCEFICMSLYASGGSSLRRLLSHNNVQLMNRLSGSIMVFLGIWLWLG
ncbi:LysE family translocator [Ferrimonas lipolytica]|uniref:LysE family translocator n=1 Tax=Ferrimonas lipolytica TaxID=2724191 RepID=A0A6H1UED4_9GAMM|nr:LysE family translocator [Ferrimonas lipolytica]QIZ77467.1 LysE family translocator [Ferrimonas lipolytica]